MPYNEHDHPIDGLTRIAMVCVALIAISFGLYLLASRLNFEFSWATQRDRLENAYRAEETSARMNLAYQGILTTRANYDSAVVQVAEFERLRGPDRGSWPQGATEQYSQLVQHRNNALGAYNTACGDYRAVLGDEYQSRVVPKDLPASCDLLSLPTPVPLAAP